MSTAHPVLEHHGSFDGMKLGRAPVKHDPRTFQLTKYLDDTVALPMIPTHFDLTGKVPSWPMYGNDRLGDCTIAAAAHMVEAWTYSAGAPVVPLDAQVLQAYWMTGSPPRPNGAPNGPTDNGRNEIDVLNYWRTPGIAGDRIAAYVQVDPKNHAHMKAAIYLFGGVYTGIALPLSAQSQKEWKSVPGSNGAPGSWGGHAVPYLAYTTSTFKCVTWGFVQPLTTGFNDKYTEEAYAILSTDLLNSGGLTPQGFNLAALQADLAAL